MTTNDNQRWQVSQIEGASTKTIRDINQKLGQCIESIKSIESMLKEHQQVDEDIKRKLEEIVREVEKEISDLLIMSQSTFDSSDQGNSEERKQQIFRMGSLIDDLGKKVGKYGVEVSLTKLLPELRKSKESEIERNPRSARRKPKRSRDGTRKSFFLKVVAVGKRGAAMINKIFRGWNNEREKKRTRV